MAPLQTMAHTLAPEVQFFAAQGCDSCGKEFAQTIHHNYPNHDFDDLMTDVGNIKTPAKPEQSCLDLFTSLSNFFIIKENPQK
ncbi:hypothetical protein BB427_03160 [Pseudoalteromonas sp. BMB]|nr:hypothetical protein BB427_03160 [Pseudoalteromonas sp. BMB]